jgi:uncharacterized OB-fold protein
MISPVKVWRNQPNIRGIVGREGSVVTYTFIRVPMVGFSEQAPYPLVVVEFDRGKRCIAQMVDYDPGDIRIGRRVRAVIRRIREPDPDGVIPYGIKVRPVPQRSGS